MLARLSLGLLAFMATVGASIVDCSDGASVFRPTTLSLTPEPPVPGQPVLMTVLFDNPGDEVTDGTVTTSITINGLPFAPSTEALCTNTQCPIPNGPVDRSATSTWPTGISGKIESRIAWTGVNGEQLLCLKITERSSESHLRKGGGDPLWNFTELWNTKYAMEVFLESFHTLPSWAASFPELNTSTPSWKEWFLNALNRTFGPGLTEVPDAVPRMDP